MPRDSLTARVPGLTKRWRLDACLGCESLSFSQIFRGFGRLPQVLQSLRKLGTAR